MPLSCSVVIDSYNYGKFVAEAVDSVLAQTLPPTEIIVVDDGSTDDTPEILRQRYGANPLVTIIQQRNGGQGMAITAGLAKTNGDLVFMLDSDDKYEPDHLEKVARAYAENPSVDYIFTGFRAFGAKTGVTLEYPSSKHLGFSVVGAMLGLHYVGGMMSTLSLRRRLLLTILPPMQQIAPRWIMGADDMLNYGSSLAGARKYFLAEPSVVYRVHQTNNSYFMMQKWVHEKWLRRNNAVAVYSDWLGLRPDLAARTDMEFASIEEPTLEQYRGYRALIWKLKLPLWDRLKMLLRIRLYFRGRKDLSLRSLLGLTVKAEETRRGLDMRHGPS